jgi:hypothetical protein
VRYTNDIHIAKILHRSDFFELGCSRKDPYSPHRGNFCRPEGERRKKLFLIIVNVLGHPKGVGGLTSYFLCGGGMDVFWNDPM